MFNKIFTYLVMAMMMCVPLLLSAAEFQPVGLRALGMGGSNVASTNDTDAAYWNPAAFGYLGTYGYQHDIDVNAKLRGADAGVGIGVSIHQQLPDLIDSIDQLNFNAISTAAANNTAFAAAQIADSLVLLKQLDGLNTPGTGVQFQVNGGTGFRIGNVGFGYRVYGEIGASALVDLNNLAVSTPAGAGAVVNPLIAAYAPAATPTVGYNAQYFSPAQLTSLSTSLQGINAAGITPMTAVQADAVVQQADTALAQAPQAAGQQNAIASTLVTLAQSQSGNTIDQNLSVLRFRGAVITEIPVSYGYAINEHLSVGGSLKYLSARVYASDVGIFNQNSSNLNTSIQNAYQDKSAFGLDLGAIYRIPQYQFGLVAKNLNTPKFSVPVVGATTAQLYTVKMNPQVRAGVAWLPKDNIVVEAGLDLTDNESTALPGYKTRYVNFGGEWKPWQVLNLRAGVYKNLSESDIGMMYTLGLGVNLWAVSWDMAAAMSSKKANFKGSSAPRSVKFATSFSTRF
ncbi:MAG: conjugal transfer protein TraF [Mariprofundaceae bacterium]|nr:conjugal transfer protein TraF [Mariprofundaceae bacterium]